MTVIKMNKNFVQALEILNYYSTRGINEDIVIRVNTK